MSCGDDKHNQFAVTHFVYDAVVANAHLSLLVTLQRRRFQGPTDADVRTRSWRCLAGLPDQRGVGLVCEADEPAFPDDLLRLQRHGHQRLVIGVIDPDRRLDGGLGELGITAKNRR